MGPTVSTVVLTDPIPAAGITYKDDIRLLVASDVDTIKMPLLYSDKVELCSYLLDVVETASWDAYQARMPLRALLLPIGLLRHAHPSTLRRFGFQDDVELWKRRVRGFWGQWKKADLDKSWDLLENFYAKHSDVLGPLGRAYFEAAHRFLDEWADEAKALLLATESGLLTMSPWSSKPMTDYRRPAEHLVDAAAEVYNKHIRGDRLVTVDLGAAHTLSLEAPREVSELDLASALLGDLPTLAQASISEILDIKEELSEPLVRFRSYIARLHDDVIAMGPMRKEEVKRHTRHAWRRDVAPAIQDIKDSMRENKYVEELLDSALSVPNWIPGVITFSVGLTSFSGLEQLFVASSGLAAVPLKALRAKIERKREIQRSELFFLSRASEQRFPRR